jgi:hypothetical protein
MRITENLQDNFPFISIITHVAQEYVGVIINQDQQITSFYDYTSIRINIFLHREIGPFKYAIKNFSTKDVKVLLGPCTSLNDIIVKRIKRKSITLIRKAT